MTQESDFIDFLYKYNYRGYDKDTGLYNQTDHDIDNLTLARPN